MIGQNLLVNREPIDITWNGRFLVSIQFNESDQFHLNGKQKEDEGIKPKHFAETNRVFGLDYDTIR